jgi:hypothetical protein
MKSCTLRWRRVPGQTGVQAPLSVAGDYVISHRTGAHVVSYRPPGKHLHIGTFKTAKAAKAAALRICRGP